MKYIFSALSTLVLPQITQAASAPTDFRSLVGLFLRFMDMLVIFIFAITFIVLMWGIVKAWILNPGNETEIENGKNMALYGVLVLVVMSGIWGILQILRFSIFAT